MTSRGFVFFFLLFTTSLPLHLLPASGNVLLLQQQWKEISPLIHFFLCTRFRVLFLMMRYKFLCRWSPVSSSVSFLLTRAALFPASFFLSPSFSDDPFLHSMIQMIMMLIIILVIIIPLSLLLLHKSNDSWDERDRILSQENHRTQSQVDHHHHQLRRRRSCL